MASTRFPHGACECVGATCCGGRGPAAYTVTRPDKYGEDKRVKVCTICDLPSDNDKVLLVGLEESLEPYIAFDELGALCLYVEIERTRESRGGALCGP